MKILNCFFISIILFSLACTKTEKQSGAAAQENQADLKEETSRIYFGINLGELEESENGSEIELDLLESDSYTLMIQRKEETMPGIVSISGYINDEETGLANLIFRDGKLSGQITLYQEGKMYELRFDENEQTHFMLPVDPDDRDVLPGGEPKEVPRNEG